MMEIPSVEVRQIRPCCNEDDNIECVFHGYTECMHDYCKLHNSYNWWNANREDEIGAEIHRPEKCPDHFTVQECIEKLRT